MISRMSTKTCSADILPVEVFANMYVVYVLFRTVYYMTEIIERWQISCYFMIALCYKLIQACL